MLIIISLLSLLLHANGLPTSFGPVTTPTTAHNFLFGRQTPCNCSGILERTLYDIVRSCLLTIAACVYRAIHQNIPNPNATWSKRVWIRIRIMVLALLAPEMMIWWAMKQWMAARVIRDEVNRQYPELGWTLTHGYFLQMGGFVQEENGHVLLLKDLLALLKERQIDINVLRKITKKEIDDHSKGDFLSKALVTLQTTWFVFECITRWQQKLLLTELEVVTLAFAVLNMLTYAFWWHKPLDVLCPIKVTIHTTPINPTPKDAGQEQDGESGSADEAEASRFIPAGPSTSPKANMKTSKAGSIRRGLGIVLSFFASGFRRTQGAFSSWGAEIASSFQRLGWLDAAGAVVGVPLEAVLNRLKGLFETRASMFGTHVPTFYAGELEEKEWNFVLYISCFIGMIFGAIHFLSWNSHFPTHIESLLWRISSVVLVVEPFLVILLTLMVQFADEINGDFVGIVALVCGFCSSTIGPIAYVLARACVLVLAFLTLHHLPSGVFETISWTSYIPHL